MSRTPPVAHHDAGSRNAFGFSCLGVSADEHIRTSRASRGPVGLALASRRPAGGQPAMLEACEHSMILRDGESGSLYERRRV